MLDNIGKATSAPKKDNNVASSGQEPKKAQKAAASLPNAAIAVNPPITQKDILFNNPAVKARIENPDLLETDRKLLKKYVNTLDDPAKAKNTRLIKSQIRSRAIMSATEILGKYTGREDMAKVCRNANALDYATEALEIFSPKEQYNICMEIYKGTLPASEQTLIDNLRRNPHSKEAHDAVFNKIYDYSYRWQESIWGTKGRVELFRRQSAFIALAQNSGVSEEEAWYHRTLDPNLFPIDDKETSALIKATLASYTPEKTDDAKWQPIIMEYYKRAVKDLYDNLEYPVPKAQNLLILSRCVAQYSNLAEGLGVPRDEIRRIESECKAHLKVNPPAKSGPTRVLTPDELPDDALTLLKSIEVDKRYTYFQFLKESIDYIIISREKLEMPSTAALVGGRSLDGTGYKIGDGIIYINRAGTEDNDEWLKYQIFDLLAHEGRHADTYRKYYRENDEVMRSIPNEGDAYTFEAGALMKLPKNGMKPKISQRIGEMIEDDIAIARGAAWVLGTSDFRGVIESDLDLDTYPTNTPYVVAYGYAEYLEQAGLIRKDEKPLFTDVLCDVISDKVDIGSIPEKTRPPLLKLLERTGPGYKGMAFEAAFVRFKALASAAEPEVRFYGDETLDRLLAYSRKYVIKTTTSDRSLPLKDINLKTIGTVPEGKTFSLVVAPPIQDPSFGFAYCKIKYEDKEGYILASHITPLESSE